MDNSDSLPLSLSAKYKESYAYETVKGRLPVILTKIVDHMYRAKNDIQEAYGENAKEEVKQVTACISKLRSELETDKPCVILRDTFADLDLWAGAFKEEASRSEEGVVSWFKSPWLFVECYMYRRVFEAFQLVNVIKDYDPFGLQKQDGFITSESARINLATHLRGILENPPSKNDAMETEFVKFIELCLWGNQCDLSISAGSRNEKQIDSLSFLKNLFDNILVNNTSDIWEHLTSLRDLRGTGILLDMVLDNAGFELFTDLCLVELLQSFGLVQKCRWYVKMMPWFVSDSTKRDFLWTLDELANSKHDSLRFLGERWKKRVETCSWTIEEELFWTLPYPYYRMQEIDPRLYKKLGESDLVIFKGDLNYRKLVSDLNWCHTTKFEKAIQSFLPTSVCSFRTSKADVFVGISEEQVKSAKAKDADWLISSNFAVIHFVKKT